MIDTREALAAAEKHFTRRAWFAGVIKGAGLAVAYDRFGPRLFGQQPDPVVTFNNAIPVLSGFGKMVIPVDEDPGWATFEPEISRYALDVFARQVLALGNNLVFNGLTQAFVAFNETPPVVSYGPKFLAMSTDAQATYLSDVLQGNFENDGVADVLAFGAIFMLLAVKEVFFLNFPKHVAVPGAEFQVLTGNNPKTGWDIMGFRGPVSAEEEQALRARAANAVEIPGIDLTSPYL